MAFCKISFDLFCDKGHNPRYRLYVNDELFAERTYIWTGTQYLRELLQIKATPGEYTIRLDYLDKCRMKIRNTKSLFGPVEVINSTTFRITQ